MKRTSEPTSHPVRALAWILCVSVWSVAFGGAGCSTGKTEGPAAAAPPGGAAPAPGAYRPSQATAGLLGLGVRDSQGEKVGTLKAVAVDLEHGRVVEVVVGYGGFLGMGQRTAAVPPAALRVDAAGSSAVLSTTKARFLAGPGFDMSQWAENFQSRQVAEVYRYYGETPYFAADGQKSETGNTATEPLGYVQRSVKLAGLVVRNPQNEVLGTVANLMFDLPRGRVIHVLVQVPGISLVERVIPATALRFNAARDGLVFNVSAKDFYHEPGFQWAAGDFPRFEQQTYSNTKIRANRGVNTRQNFQEGSASSYTPLVQGPSFSDVDITYRIYSQMRAEASLSQNAQNVEVATRNRRITLRGHVNTDAAKRLIGEIAARVGRPENVSNLLEVRPLAPEAAPAR